MDEPTFKILFYGQCKSGFALKDVQQNLAIFLRKPASSLDKVFSGKTVVMKRSNRFEEISRFAEHLTAIGLIVHIDSTKSTPQADTLLAEAPPAESVPAEAVVAPTIELAAPELPPVETPVAEHSPQQALVLDLNLPSETLTRPDVTPVADDHVSPPEPSNLSTPLAVEVPDLLLPEISPENTPPTAAPSKDPAPAAMVVNSPKATPATAAPTKAKTSKSTPHWVTNLGALFNAVRARINAKRIAKPTSTKAGTKQSASSGSSKITPIVTHPTPISTPIVNPATQEVAPSAPPPMAKTPEKGNTTTPVPKAKPEPKVKKVKPRSSLTWQDRAKYRIDTFMAKGGASTFQALLVVFVVIFVVMAALRALLQQLHPEFPQQEGELDFVNNIYMTFLQLTDPGNMAQDLLSSGWYKILAIIGGFAGIILFSALIAFITTTLDQKISALKRGRSTVIEKGHTLILGWNEQRIVEIIRELVIANESESDACVVILADHDKESMDDMLRLRLPNLKATRIVTRNGRVSTLANLDMVSIEQSRSVIILASCEDTDSIDKKMMSDASVIQTILAVTGKIPKNKAACVVAEIFNSAYRDIVSHTFSDSIVTVNTSDILAKLLVQTSRSVGLSTVYNEILSFDGCEMYFHHADWRDNRFGDLAFYFADGVPMGVRQANGTLLLNPDNQYAMQADDHILILADDDSTVKFQKTACAQASYRSLPNRKMESTIERELIIGWNHKARIILQEFADYVTTGSQINILLAAPTDQERDEIRELNENIKGVDIQLLELNSLNRDHLLEIQPFSYNNIIILASVSDGHDAQQVDSENIVTLLLLRSIFNEYPTESASTKLITEVLDSQNLPLVARAGVKDVIISSRLVSMIMAQISQSKDIKRVYDDLFSEDGSEIYLKPASLYFDQLPVTLNFADLIALAQQRKEICLGIKLKAHEFDAEKNNGVQLIPEKMKPITLTAEDSLVVLAEDEF